MTMFLMLLLVDVETLQAETVSENEMQIIVDNQVPEKGPVLPDGFMFTEATLDTESLSSDPQVMAMINRAVGECIHPGMTDLQKALALHDWLAIHCRYDHSLTNYDGRDALVDGTAVCQGYYEAYKMLLDAVGIENARAWSSDHVWNLVKIDGEWYHVDPTWDGQEIDFVGHDNFLKSDRVFNAGHGTRGQDYPCTSTKYDKGAFWDIKANGEYMNTGYFYNSAGGAYHLTGTRGSINKPGKITLVYRNDATGTQTEVYSFTPTQWWQYRETVEESKTAWVAPNSQLLLYGDELYFNDAKHVYRVTNGGKNVSVYYTYTGSQFIYGMMEQNGKLVLGLKPHSYTNEITYQPIDYPIYRWEWPQVVQLPSAYAFVNRLYTVCLGRNAESAGLNDWYAKLANHEQSAAQVAQGFFFSPEFQNKNYSNEEYIKVLYRTMFGREADEGGLNDWLNQMENGMSREYVYRGFAQSPEFSNLCAGYGVIRGEVTLTAYRDQNAGATGFIARLYTKMLGRSYDDAGLEYWCRMYLTGQQSIEEVASHGFLHSEELLNQKLSDKEFVTRMYQTFLNREPDAEGLQYWLAKLKTGEKTRDNLVYGFTLSREFANVKQAYGLP